MTEEKILFQYVMNYKAYRTEMIAKRACITLVAAGAACVLCLVSVLVGIFIAVSIVFVGLISVLVSFGNEKTYTVYNTRIVIKTRGKDDRLSVPTDNVVSVKYKSAFYEKRFCTGTVTVRIADKNGRKKSCKLRHIFDAKPVVNYLSTLVDTENTNDENRE